MRIFKLFFIILLISSCSLALGQKTLTILHTNDTHSQIEPVERGENIHRGCIEKRFFFIDSLRKIDPDLILLDAGDFCQGTPFFNFYKGEVEVKMLNLLGYDVAGLGNHEFDNGVESLANILEDAKFDIVCANYDFSKTPLKSKIKPYSILERHGLKIGIFGLLPDLTPLVLPKNRAGLTFKNPYTCANTTAAYLKNVEDCDIIICLSHLGFGADKELIQQTENIHLVIGGHSHDFIDLETLKNSKNQDVYYSQMKKSGFYLGSILLKYAEF